MVSPDTRSYSSGIVLPLVSVCILCVDCVCATPLTHDMTSQAVIQAVFLVLDFDGFSFHGVVGCPMCNLDFSALIDSINMILISSHYEIST